MAEVDSTDFVSVFPEAAEAASEALEADEAVEADAAVASVVDWAAGLWLVVSAAILIPHSASTSKGPNGIFQATQSLDRRSMLS